MSIKKYYLKNISEIIREFDSSERGLSSSEAKNRLVRDGFNEFVEAERDSYFSIFLSQFKSPLIYILLISGVIVLFIGESLDTLVIFVVLFFNALIGTIQEGRAQNTFLALKKFTKSEASVIRGGREIIIPDSEVVVGDIITLREGEKIPADARIIEHKFLMVSEAAITGESIAKPKNSQDLTSKELSIGDQENMVFKGTVVSSGNGKALVVATGMNTFLGSIAKEALEIDTEFPLKDEIRKLSRFIIMVVCGVGLLIFVMGIYGGQSVIDIFKTIIAISVSVIPEGLPIVMTLVLATGVWRMGKKNVLVKKMQAVEVLGEIKVLAVDKTGTVTKNELVIKKVLIGGKIFEVGGVGYSTEGELLFNGKVVSPLNHEEIMLAGKVATLGAGANLVFDEKRNVWKISGDPTEGAMLVFGKKIGFNREDLLFEMPMIDEIPFDYKLKFHATLNKNKENNFLAISGSPEEVLNLSVKEWVDGKIIPLEAGRRAEILRELDKMFLQGLRVIAFAYQDYTKDKIDMNQETDLILGGFWGIQDALRTEVREAVKNVNANDIRVVMITGDHEITAKAIAEEAGIYKKGDIILSGLEVEKMDKEDLAKNIKETSVFYRVNPEHKLKIIKAYQLNGMTIAMTGDGVNDALSLSAADIGIGMGRIGTEVAKESSDIILLDDNFGNIIYGVKEGKKILVSIKKVVLYLISTSMGEVLTILGALFLGFPLPILATQILWLNLVTDGFLDIALAMDSSQDEAQPGNKKNSLMDEDTIVRMILMAITMAFGAIYLFSQNYQQDIAKAWTISLCVLAAFQWFNAWNCRDEKKSLFFINPLKNKFLIGATLTVILLQISAVYSPLFQKALKTVPLNLDDWFIILGVASSIVVVEELRKIFYRR